MKQKKLATITLVAAMTMLGSGVSVNALPAVTSTDYTITIPATLEVANAGWNATDGITASWKPTEGVDYFDSGKKLTVTAESANGWALKSDDNSVGYNLAAAEADYSVTAEAASWEFSADELNAESGTNKAMGIIVDDYSNKPAGTYQDTVTFTAKVENAAGPLAAAFEDGAKFKVGYKWNRDGRNTTYLEFTNSGGTYSLTSISGAGQDGFNSSALTVKDGNVLALDLVCDPYGEGNRMDEFEAQIEFDATYSTYKYSSKGELFTGIISVSVNDTDITNQLRNAVTIKTVTWDNPITSFIGDIYDGESKSKDGVTVKVLSGEVDGHDGSFRGLDGGDSFQFSVASGNITKIEITTSSRSVDDGNGWSSNVWTGKANTVNFGVHFYPTKIVFTIEE